MGKVNDLNLNPCPRCNKVPTVSYWNTTDTYEVYCIKCNIGTVGLTTRERVLDYWNNVYIPRRKAEIAFDKSEALKKRTRKKSSEEDE